MWAATALAQHLNTRVQWLGNGRLPGHEAPLWKQVLQNGRRSSVGLGPVITWLRTRLAEDTAWTSLHPAANLWRPTASSRRIDRLIRAGLGRDLAARADRTTGPFISTFAPAALAVATHTDAPVYCLVTPCDVNRSWVPIDPSRGRVHYLTTTRRAATVLEAFGVPNGCIHYTGLPFPFHLLGGPRLTGLKHDLAARLLRLDPNGLFLDTRLRTVEDRLGSLASTTVRPSPLVTVVVGGTARQVAQARRTVSSLLDPARRGEVRIGLVIEPDPEADRPRWVDRLSREELPDRALVVLVGGEPEGFADRFFTLLQNTDVLCTRPSAIVPVAGMGIPLALLAPASTEESVWRRWVRERGAGSDCPRGWRDLNGRLADGTLAATAWSAYRKMPKRGLFRIQRLLSGQSSGTAPEPEARVRSKTSA